MFRTFRQIFPSFRDCPCFTRHGGSLLEMNVLRLRIRNGCLSVSEHTWFEPRLICLILIYTNTVGVQNVTTSITRMISPSTNEATIKPLEPPKHSIPAIKIIDQPTKFKDPIKNNVGYEHVMMNHSLLRPNSWARKRRRVCLVWCNLWNLLDLNYYFAMQSML